MKITTLLLIVLWPTSLMLVVRAVMTTYAAWEYAGNKRLQQLNELQGMVRGRITVYPWRTRCLHALIAVMLLAYLQGWLILE